MGDQV